MFNALFLLSFLCCFYNNCFPASTITDEEDTIDEETGITLTNTKNIRLKHFEEDEWLKIHTILESEAFATLIRRYPEIVTAQVGTKTGETEEVVVFLILNRKKLNSRLLELRQKDSAKTQKDLALWGIKDELGAEVLCTRIV